MTLEEAKQRLIAKIEEWNKEPQPRFSYEFKGIHVFNYSDDIEFTTPLDQTITKKEFSDMIRQGYPNHYFFDVEVTDLETDDYLKGGQKDYAIYAFDKEKECFEAVIFEL